MTEKTPALTLTRTSEVNTREVVSPQHLKCWCLYKDCIKPRFPHFCQDEVPVVAARPDGFLCQAALASEYLQITQTSSGQHQALTDTVTHERVVFLLL